MSSFGLSPTEVARLYRQAKKGQLDQEQIDNIWNSIPAEQKEAVTEQLLSQYVIPHIKEVRQRAAEARPNEEIRAELEALSEEEQQTEFLEATAEVFAALLEIRERPRTGLRQLKSLLRDPYLIEALLLVFNNDRHIDPEYSDSMKNYMGDVLEEWGVAIAPEMYAEAEVRRVYDRVNLSLDDVEHR